MKIRMRVSVSRSDGFCARRGEEIEVDADEAQQMIADGRAEAVDEPKAPAPATGVEPKTLRRAAKGV